ncbi:MAG TPA: CAP domain-containing protein [Acidimicrobiia bacterium]|nr:CAP domain-containing protein [Acidimicrobiia bacterium]
MRSGARMMVVALTAMMLAATMPLVSAAAVDPVSAEVQFTDLINQERTNRGLKPLVTHPDLVAGARSQANAIRNAGRLFHNADLGSVTTGWTKLGENVGYGSSVSGLHTAFMNSAAHRSNILDAAYTHVGVGVVVSGTTVWVAEVFMQSKVAITQQQTTFTPPFRDDDGLSYEQDIIALAAAGITSGCAPERFCPFGYVSREQMASFLQRGLSLQTVATDFFWDDTLSGHHSAINAIAQASISTGCGSGRYCPASAVSRGEMATFLARALGLPPATKDFFWDDNGSPHEDAINRLAAAGITTGCGGGAYCPWGGLSRGEMASFLVRGLSL